MKTNKVKGFTLVELIVVIAIIGVLAAILVPSMLGYVKKANISAANSNAKTVYNAAATACTDCDTNGKTVPSGEVDLKTGTDDFHTYFNSAIGTNALAGLTVCKAKLAAGACTDTLVKKGSYYGQYPTATTSDNATTLPAGWTE